jgi:hypothetical protein
MVKRLLSKTLKDGFKYFRTVEELHTVIDADVLPLEYGGSVPIKDMMQNTKLCLEQYSLEGLTNFENQFESDFLNL